MAKLLTEEFTVRHYINEGNPEVEIRYVLEDNADGRLKGDVLLLLSALPANVEGAWTAFLNTLRAAIKTEENIP